MVGGARPGSRAEIERDQALRRVTRTRRWLIAGAGALSAALAGLVSAAAPGHTLGSKAHAARAVSKSAPKPQLPPPATADQLGLQSPGQAPQSVPTPPVPTAPTASAPSQLPPPVTSGGS